MPYMIEVVIPSSVQKIVTNKYVRMYQNLHRSQGRAYPRAQLINNIRIAPSINGDYIEPSIIRNPIIQDWKAKGYRVIPFKHWFYAVQLRRMANGETAAVAVDARYEGDYHNDTMQTKPYNESVNRKLKIILKESQLQRIIRESIKKVLNII